MFVWVQWRPSSTRTLRWLARGKGSSVATDHRVFGSMTMRACYTALTRAKKSRIQRTSCACLARHLRMISDSSAVRSAAVCVAEGVRQRSGSANGMILRATTSCQFTLSCVHAQSGTCMPLRDVRAHTEATDVQKSTRTGVSQRQRGCAPCAVGRKVGEGAVWVVCISCSAAAQGHRLTPRWLLRRGWSHACLTLAVLS
jgi:hypothetical protein